MPHQDFEKYANDKSMKGDVSNIFNIFFKKYIYCGNRNFKILDFGCGDGKYFPYFKKLFHEANIYGIEISDIRVARCKKVGWINVQKIKALEKIPFENNFFDIINFDQVIEHIKSEEVNFYLKEFKRILKPGGKMIVMTPNYPIKRLYDFLNFLITGNPKRIKDDPTHISFYNFKKLKNVMDDYSSARVFPTGGIFYKIAPFNFFSNKIIGIIIK